MSVPAVVWVLVHAHLVFLLRCMFINSYLFDICTIGVFPPPAVVWVVSGALSLHVFSKLRVVTNSKMLNVFMGCVFPLPRCCVNSDP